LSQADVPDIASGYAINLIASDLERFTFSVSSIILLLQAFFELCSILYLTFYLSGWKTLSGVSFMIFLLLYYGMARKLCTTPRSGNSRVADQRVNFMNSILYGIRTVKINVWEWPFMEKNTTSTEVKVM